MSAFDIDSRWLSETVALSFPPPFITAHPLPVHNCCLTITLYIRHTITLNQVNTPLDCLFRLVSEIQDAIHNYQVSRTGVILEDGQGHHPLTVRAGCDLTALVLQCHAVDSGYFRISPDDVWNRVIDKVGQGIFISI